MSKQRQALPYLIRQCCEVDSNCGIQLQGSLALDAERDDSDIDLTVVLDHAVPIVQPNVFLNQRNHGAMIRVHVDQFATDVDINWIYESDLVKLSYTPGALWWYMFASGIPLYDPAKRAQRCQDALRKWFETHPDILRAWEKQQIELNKHKKDPRHVLEFSTQPAFCQHLKRIVEESHQSRSA